MDSCEFDEKVAYAFGTVEESTYPNNIINNSTTNNDKTSNGGLSNKNGLKYAQIRKEIQGENLMQKFELQNSNREEHK